MLLYSIPKHLFIFSLLIAFASAKNKNTKRDHNRHASDLPNTRDIWKYVNSLDKILNFCLRNKQEIDINLYFGIFLVHVNLKSIVSEKSSKLPTDLRVKVNGLVKKCQRISTFFDQMVRQDTTAASQNHKLIYTLMNQEDHWLERMRRFQTDTWKLPKLSPSQEEHKYSNWNKYAKNIMELAHWVPNPAQSDKCLESLARNPNMLTDTLTKCQVDEICYISLTQGDDFGYALTHRLVQLLMARLGRGCYFFTPELDTELARRFCGTLHAEAGFIARNNYTLAADLLFEQISMCALHDQTQFVRRSFIGSFQKFQVTQGCFQRHGISTDKSTSPRNLKPNTKNKTNSTSQWQMIRSQSGNSLVGTCNRHLTAVAATTLAAAVRLILYAFY